MTKIEIDPKCPYGVPLAGEINKECQALLALSREKFENGDIEGAKKSLEDALVADFTLLFTEKMVEAVFRGVFQKQAGNNS